MERYRWRAVNSRSANLNDLTYDIRSFAESALIRRRKFSPRRLCIAAQCYTRFHCKYSVQYPVSALRLDFRCFGRPPPIHNRSAHLPHCAVPITRRVSTHRVGGCRFCTADGQCWAKPKVQNISTVLSRTFPVPTVLLREP